MIRFAARSSSPVTGSADTYDIPLPVDLPPLQSNYVSSPANKWLTGDGVGEMS